MRQASRKLRERPYRTKPCKFSTFRSDFMTSCVRRHARNRSIHIWRIHAEIFEVSTLLHVIVCRAARKRWERPRRARICKTAFRFAPFLVPMLVSGALATEASTNGRSYAMIFVAMLHLGSNACQWRSCVCYVEKRVKLCQNYLRFAPFQ